MLPLIEFFGSLSQHSIFDDAFLHHDFRRTLYEEIGLAINFCQGCHHLSLSRERQLLEHVHLLAEFFIILALGIEPEQESRLGRVSDRFAVIQFGCRVEGDGCIEQRLIALLEFQGAHLHLVLGKRTGFIGTDHGNGTHGFAGMELADQIVRLQHSSHVERQGKGNRHRQSLRHRHHNQGNSHHEVFQHDFCHIEIILAAPCRIGEDIVNQEDEEGCHRYYRAYLGNHLCQLVELHVKRCLHRSLFGRFLRHLTNLGSIAHGSNHELASAIHHHGRTEDDVARIGSIATAFQRFLGNGFARQGRFIHLQVVADDEFAIGRHLVAHFHEHYISHHHIMARNLHHLTIAAHLYRLLFAECRKQIKLLSRIALKVEAHGGSKENCHEDTDGLHEILFDKSKDEGYESRHKEYLDNRIAILIQIQFP